MGQLRNLTGQRFGRLAVLEQAEPFGRESGWLCVCDCGTKKRIRGRCLVRGETRSCGCLHREVARRSTVPPDKWLGRRFGSLTILGHKPSGTARRWPTFHCRCDCGAETFAVGYALRAGKHVSCGQCTRRPHDLVGRRFGRLLAIKIGPKSNAGLTRWWCQCDCGRKKLIQANALTSGDTTACGCRHRTRVNDTLFGEELTEDEAYWLGMLYTDGNMRRDPYPTIHLGLKTADQAHIRKFISFLGATAEPRLTPPPANARGCAATAGTGMAMFTVANRTLAANLRRHGLHPNKSWTITPWKGPPHLLPHFWRGCLDGDGYIVTSQQNRARVGFCGNEAMVVGMAAFVAKHTGAKGHTTLRASAGKDAKAAGKRHAAVMWSGNRISKRILCLLGYDTTATALERKRLKALEVLSR